MTGPNGGLGGWVQETTREHVREKQPPQNEPPARVKTAMLRKSCSKIDSWNIESLHSRGNQALQQ